MRAACTAGLVIALALATQRAPVAHAQGAPAESAPAESDAPSVTVRWDRPPAGTLERGVLGVPMWVVVASGVLVVTASGLALIAAARRGRRSAR